MAVNVVNTDANLDGKTLMATENAETVTGLKTFNRGAAAPFAVDAASTKVANLDADKLDGKDEAVFAEIAQSETVSGLWTFDRGAATAPFAVAQADAAKVANLDADKLDGQDGTFYRPAAQASAQVFNSTTQNINNSAWTAITFNSEDHDTGAMHDTAVNTSRLTVPASLGGLYLICGTINFTENATGVRGIRITKNGGTLIACAVASTGSAAPGTGLGEGLMCSCLVSLAAADYVELEGFQSSGGALATGNAANRHQQNQFYAVKLT